MFGLAMGEWFMLRPLRRVILLMVAIVFAVVTNLARTVALSLQAEWHGLGAVEHAHDLIGNIVITTLILAIWLAGKLLAPRKSPTPLPRAGEMKKRARVFITGILASRVPGFRWVFLLALAGFVAARVVYGQIEAGDPAQSAPYFIAKIDNISNRSVEIPRAIWNELRPTSGEYIQRKDVDLPRGTGDSFHFFWKPSPWNRFVLVHRPDICMPGVGWQVVGSPEPVDVMFGERSARLHIFRFRRGNVHAIELWGAWRNGEPVALDYEPAQVLGAAIAPPTMNLEGKRKSATEIVACSLISENVPPDAKNAVALLRSVFDYNPR